MVCILYAAMLFACFFSLLLSLNACLFVGAWQFFFCYLALFMFILCNCNSLKLRDLRFCFISFRGIRVLYGSLSSITNGNFPNENDNSGKKKVMHIAPRYDSGNKTNRCMSTSVNFSNWVFQTDALGEGLFLVKKQYFFSPKTKCPLSCPIPFYISSIRSTSAWPWQFCVASKIIDSTGDILERNIRIHKTSGIDSNNVHYSTSPSCFGKIIVYSTLRQIRNAWTNITIFHQMSNFVGNYRIICKVKWIKVKFVNIFAGQCSACECV